MGTIRTPAAPKVSDWLRNPAVAHATVMAKIASFRDVGGYDSRFRRGQDYDLWLRMLNRGYEFHNLERALYACNWTRGDYKRKTLNARLSEVRIRYEGFGRLGLGWRAYPYVLRPLIVGVLPQGLMSMMHNRRFRSGSDS